MLYLKALHIIFIVTWFSGLFYFVRLLVYQAEEAAKNTDESRGIVSYLKKIQRPLWYGITWPSAILTLVFGTWLLVVTYGSFIPDWMYLKLAFVAGLFAYHLYCGYIFSRFQKDEIIRSGYWLRIWNEVATLFLFTIVFIVVIRDLTGWISGLVGLVVLSVLLMAGIRMYRRVREKQKS